jgi:hypothetical protein
MSEIFSKDVRGKNEVDALSFISEAFAQRHEKQVYYRITSAFFNSLFFFEKMKGVSLDGLMYPSANTKGKGINLVLKRELIDNETLSCSYANMFAAQRHPSNRKDLSVRPASSDAKIEKNGSLHFAHIW